jgi:hypothetical protein
MGPFLYFLGEFLYFLGGFLYLVGSFLILSLEKIIIRTFEMRSKKTSCEKLVLYVYVKVFKFIFLNFVYLENKII